MQIKDIMSTNPDVFSPDMTLEQAAQTMFDHDIGFLPIGENDRLIGTITDRDIVIRAVATGKPPSTPIRAIMTDAVRYCFENDDVEKAAKLMCDLHIRRLIILNADKRIVGIISLGDIARKSKDTKLTGKVTESVSEEV